MNVKRGLWRAWIFVSVLWVIGTLALAALILPDNAAKKYQYVHVMRSDVPDPNKVDWTKDYYALMQSPARNILTASFDPVGYQYVTSWDENVKKGTMIVAEFPDKSKLYLTTQLTKEDQEYVAKQLWNQRWWRYGSEALPFAVGAIVPPVILLLLGTFLLWVFRGFARD
jgi:hypothetical protein